MSKKDAFFSRLDRGITPDRAAELSDITSRKVKSKYVKEWHARQAETTVQDPPDRPQFEREFLALPAELQYFYATHRDCWGDFADDFAEGRRLQEMLEEWRLFYYQTPAVRASWLRATDFPDRYTAGALERWLKTGMPSKPAPRPETRVQAAPGTTIAHAIEPPPAPIAQPEPYVAAFTAQPDLPTQLAGLTGDLECATS